VAQEAMKAVTHHTTPLKQFIYTDSSEALPGDYSKFDAAKLTPQDCAPVCYSETCIYLGIHNILAQISLRWTSRRIWMEIPGGT
jgi:hypothetical protein